eukprot:jgi/Orpsp1_1/1185535/evm.model.c7180000094283.1
MKETCQSEKCTVAILNSLKSVDYNALSAFQESDYTFGEFHEYDFKEINEVTATLEKCKPSTSNSTTMNI